MNGKVYSWTEEDNEVFHIVPSRSNQINSRVLPRSTNTQPVRQQRRHIPKVDLQHGEMEDGCDPGNDKEQRPWSDYYTFLASDLARNVSSIQLDDASLGQACFCVAGFSTEDDGTYLGIKIDHFVHVYRCPLTFKKEDVADSQQQSCVFVCDCGQHDHLDVLHGMNTSRMTYEKYNSLITPCQHTLAVQWLHDHQHLSYDSALTEEACNFIDNISFSSHVSSDLASR